MALLPIRVTRAIFGFLAVWCLGCSGFDALLDGLMERPATGDPSCMSMTGSPESAATDASSDVSTIRDASRHVAGCGCDHCAATRAQPAPIARSPEPTPQDVARI